MIVPASGGTYAGPPPEENAFDSSGPPAPDSPASSPPRSGRRTVKVSGPARPSRTTPEAPKPQIPALPVFDEPQRRTLDDLEEPKLPCPNCRAPLAINEDLCDACGYHTILKKVLDLNGVNTRDSSTGFERAIKGQISESETPESALLWVKLVAGFFLVLFVLLCFGRWGLAAAVTCALAYAVYRFVWAPKRGEAGSELNRDPVSIACWTGMLFLQRAVGWRLPRWPFPKTRSLSLRDPAFSDDDLEELDGLADVQTLDFEGTKISDGGLIHLCDSKQLRFLVLRRTRVTTGGVTKLQRALPEVWIWH
jgi:hypothetical protein